MYILIVKEKSEVHKAKSKYVALRRVFSKCRSCIKLITNVYVVNDHDDFVKVINDLQRLKIQFYYAQVDCTNTNIHI